MLVLMLSLAGMPPFVGFWAKWSVLREVIAADFMWLAVVAGDDAPTPRLPQPRREMH